VHPTQYMLPFAHPSPQTKRHHDRLSRLCTARGGVSSNVSRNVFSPKNCAFAWGDLDPYRIHGSLIPARFQNPNCISIGSAVFAQLTSECGPSLPPQNCEDLNGSTVPLAHTRQLMTVSSGMHGYVLSSKKNCPFARGIWTSSNACFLGPIRVHNL